MAIDPGLINDFNATPAQAGAGEFAAKAGELVASTQDPELVLNLREQLAAQEALVRAMRRDGLPYYRPHAKQQAFHEACATYRRRAVFAGNRFGKSQCGAAEDCAWLRGERPWYPSGHPMRTAGIPQRPVKGLVITIDWDKVDEIWTNEEGDKPGKLWRYIPRDMVVAKQRHSGSRAYDFIALSNGSILRFDTVKSYMTNPLGSESSDWDFIHVDEPCPEGMFKAAARGLIDRHGFAWFTLTAISEPWIVDLFYGDSFGGTPKDGTWAVTGDTYDNTYLTPQAIAEFEETLTEDEKSCRIHGIPLVLSGLVYKEFSQAKHVLTDCPAGWEAPNNPPADYCIYVFIDPHPQTPNAVLFCAVSPQGYRFYYDEIYEKWTTDELSAAIRKRIFGRRLIACRIDPLAYVPDPITRRVPAQEFQRNGIPVMEASKDLHNGIIHVQQELKRTPPPLFFGAHLRRTIWEFRHYIWKKDGSNKPVDKDDHMMENLYRCELLRPQWYDPAKAPAPIRPYKLPTLNLHIPMPKPARSIIAHSHRSPYGN